MYLLIFLKRNITRKQTRYFWDGKAKGIILLAFLIFPDTLLFHHEVWRPQ